MLVGVSQASVQEAYQFALDLYPTVDRKTGAMAEGSTIKSILWLGSRILGAALLIASFGWFGYSWLVVDMPLAVALMDGVILYIGALICYTFPTMWTWVSATFFLVASIASGKKLKDDATSASSSFNPHLETLSYKFEVPGYETAPA